MTTNPTPTWVTRLPFYYGWIIVGAQFVAMFATAGPTVWAFGLFVGPMQNELGWSHSTIFGALTTRLLIGVFFIPLTSRLMDKPRWPRIIMFGTSVLWAITLMAVSQIHSVIAFYLIFGILGGISAAGVSGQLYQALVPKWFIRRRGLAVSIGTMGSPAAAFLAPFYVTFAIDAFGWRTAWLIVGIVMLILMTPLTLLVKGSPEEIGLLPDGRARSGASSENGPPSARLTAEHSFTVREALRQRSTWLVIAATTLAAPTLGGHGVHVVTYYIESGIDRTWAAFAVSTYGIFAIIGRFAWGMLADRYHIRGVTLAISLAIAASLSTLLRVDAPAAAIVYGITSGLTIGGYVALAPLIWSNYFGRAHLGAIRGAFAPLAMLGGASGPWLIATIHDTTGSYRPGWIVLLSAWLIAALLIYLAKPLKPLAR
jgi:sugar phosphate permease